MHRSPRGLLVLVLSVSPGWLLGALAPAGTSDATSSASRFCTFTNSLGDRCRQLDSQYSARWCTGKARGQVGASCARARHRVERNESYRFVNTQMRCMWIHCMSTRTHSSDILSQSERFSSPQVWVVPAPQQVFEESRMRTGARRWVNCTQF